MAEKQMLTVVFKNIANAIRGQSKGVALMTPAQMKTEVEALPVWQHGLCAPGLIGGVNGAGVLQPSTYQCSFASSEIVSIPDNMLYYRFRNCNGITSISLPNLATIGSYGLYGAFMNCTGLVSVDMGGVTDVGEYGMHDCFNGCTSLTTVNFRNMTNVGNLGLNSVFEGCTSLAVVDWSQATKVPNIGTNSFKDTNANYKVIVPDSLYSSWRLQTAWYAYRDHLVKASEWPS